MFNFTGSTGYNGSCFNAICVKPKASRKNKGFKGTIKKDVIANRVTTTSRESVSSAGVVFSSRIKAISIKNGNGSFYTERQGSSWFRVGTDIGAISDACYVPYNGKLYLFGGLSNQSATVAKLRVFDPSTNVVTLIDSPTQPSPRYHASATIVGSEMYILGGGESPSASSWIDEFWKYDIETGVWTALNTLFNDPAAGTLGRGEGLAMLNGNIYTIDVNHWSNGLIGWGGISRYNVASNNWTETVMNPNLPDEDWLYMNSLKGYRGHLWYIAVDKLWRFTPDNNDATFFTLLDNSNAPLIGWKEFLIYPMGAYGQVGDSVGVHDTFYYDIKKSAFGKFGTTGTDAQTPISNFGHAVFENGQIIYIIGGENSDEYQSYNGIYALDLREFFYDDN